MTVSETGGGGIWEWVNATSPPPGLYWSQTFQAALVTADVAAIASNPRVSGLTVWQFSDIKVEGCPQCDYPTPWPATLTQPWNCSAISTACGRPGGENHKGAVDAWRRPKLEFGLVAAQYGVYGAAGA
jgi:hypothetical protein